MWNAHVLYKNNNPMQKIKLLTLLMQMIEQSIQKYSNRDLSSIYDTPSFTLNPLTGQLIIL